jgi:hypothetical protein
MEGVT